MEVEQPGLGGAAREGVPPARGCAPRGRARQPEGRRPSARRLRRGAQPAVPRRARALRRHRAAVPGAAPRSQGQGRVGRAARAAEGEGSALRIDRAGADLPRPLGAALGGHAHPRHHEAPGGGDVRRGEAAPARASGRAVPLLPPRHPHRAPRRSRRDRGRLLPPAAGLAGPPGGRAVGRAAGASDRSKHRRAVA